MFAILIMAVILDLWILLFLCKKSTLSLIVKNIQQERLIYPKQNRIIFNPIRFDQNSGIFTIAWDTNIHHPGCFYYRINQLEWSPLIKNKIQVPLNRKKINLEIKFENNVSNHQIIRSFSFGNSYNCMFIHKWDAEKAVVRRRFDFIDPGDHEYIVHLVKRSHPSIEEMDELDKSIHLMQFVDKLVRNRSNNQNYDYYKNPTSHILKCIKKNEGGQCGTCAFIFVGMAKALDMTARPIGCYWYSQFIPGISAWQHVTSEVWIEQLQKWIVMDSSLNAFFKYEDEFLSALDLHKLYIKGLADQIEVFVDGKSTSIQALDSPDPSEEIDLAKTDSANYFAYYTHLLFPKENFSWKPIQVPFIGPLLKKLNNPSSFRKIPILNKIFPRYYHWVDAQTPVITKTKYAHWYLADLYIFAHLIIFLGFYGI